MDPNQEQRKTCAYCDRRLPAGKTKFCTKRCELRKRRAREDGRKRARGETPWRDFVHSVRLPIGVTSYAKRLDITEDAARHVLALNVQNGLVKGFYRDGELRAIGVPLREGERSALAGLGHSDAELRRRDRARKKRKRANRRAREMG